MTVKVTSVYSSGVSTFGGTPDQVMAKLYVRFPWLREDRSVSSSSRQPPQTLQDALTRLNQSQSLSVEVTSA